MSSNFTAAAGGALLLPVLVVWVPVAVVILLEFLQLIGDFVGGQWLTFFDSLPAK